jgi:hypothetical protein
VPIVELSRCDLGETWQEEDESISLAVHNFLINLNRQEFEKVALMVRQTEDLRSHARDEEPQLVATSDIGLTFYEGSGEFSISLYNFSFYLSTEEFAQFASMVKRTEIILTGEFPARKMSGSSN